MGKRRTVYIPEVKPAVERPTNAPVPSQYWKLRVNWVEMIDSVKSAAGGNLAVGIKAPLTVTVEVIRQKGTGTLSVHLINYDAARNPLEKDIGARLSVRNIGKVGQVS